jgi:predicted peptidase
MDKPMDEPSAPTPGNASRRVLLGASLLLSPLALAACAHGVAGPRPPPLPADLREGEQRPWLLSDTTTPSGAAAEPYRRMQLAIPARYAASARPWPLLLFLHGAGERGYDIEDVKRCGPPMLAARGIAFPMIVCSPQADPGARWQPPRLHALVAALGERFAIDPRRVLATGLSLGGGGVWRWACEFPDDLAGIAPVCGSCDPAAVHAMLRVPVRAYHGDQDPLVPVARQQAPIAELQRQGGTASLTVFKGVGHDSWTSAYEDAELWRWLLGQARA